MDDIDTSRAPLFERYPRRRQCAPTNTTLVSSETKHMWSSSSSSSSSSLVRAKERREEELREQLLLLVRRRTIEEKRKKKNPSTEDVFFSFRVCFEGLRKRPPEKEELGRMATCDLRQDNTRGKSIITIEIIHNKE